MKKSYAILVLVSICFSISSQEIIKMHKEGDVYTVPCIVNGLKLRFIFDTGASNVCISLTEATFMLKNGYLNKNDIIGSTKSMIADGSLVENTQIILREVQIGMMKLTNVTATVMHNIKAPLLLGQSAIQKLGIVQLQGDELILLSNRTNTDNVTSHKFEPNWFEFYQDDEQEVEIDLNSIIREANTISFWERWTYANPKNNIHKTVSKRLCDCSNKKTTLISWVDYDRAGKVLESITSNELKFWDIVPGSIGEIILKTACRKKTVGYYTYEYVYDYLLKYWNNNKKTKTFFNLRDIYNTMCYLRNNNVDHTFLMFDDYNVNNARKIHEVFLNSKLSNISYEDFYKKLGFNKNDYIIDSFAQENKDTVVLIPSAYNNIITIFNILIAEDYDLTSLENFCSKLKDTTKVRVLYDTIAANNYKIPDYETDFPVFESFINKIIELSQV
jgi:clan AA aspartic protease (TIGR02281 family)